MYDIIRTPQIYQLLINQTPGLNREISDPRSFFVQTARRGLLHVVLMFCFKMGFFSRESNGLLSVLVSYSQSAISPNGMNGMHIIKCIKL